MAETGRQVKIHYLVALSIMYTYLQMMKENRMTKAKALCVAHKDSLYVMMSDRAVT